MSERQPMAPERAERHEAGELEALAREQLDQLRHTPEAAAEQAAEQRAEQAREIIERHEPEPQLTPAEPPPPPLASLAGHFDRLLNYRDTLSRVQRQLKPASRRFSAVIHAPAVERTSEALGKTVLRPSVVTGALWGAAITGLIFYIAARHYGFLLSGSEMPLALVGGGLIGLIIERLAQRFRQH